jgi:hypothetical protein
MRLRPSANRPAPKTQKSHSLSGRRQLGAKANPLFSGRPQFARFMLCARTEHIRARLQDEKNRDDEADFGDEAPYAEIKRRPPKTGRGRIGNQCGVPFPIIPKRFEDHRSNNEKAGAADPPAADVQPAKAPLLNLIVKLLFHSAQPPVPASLPQSVTTSNSQESRKNAPLAEPKG